MNKIKNFYIVLCFVLFFNVNLYASELQNNLSESIDMVNKIHPITINQMLLKAQAINQIVIAQALIKLVEQHKGCE